MEQFLLAFSSEQDGGLIVGLAIILLLGVGAQWLAWRIKVPSILLLLVFGFAYGLQAPDSLQPENLFGALLLPFVSLSVSVILFEGGLSLQFSELSRVGGVVRNLVTIGAGVTWVLASIGGHFLLDFSWGLSILLGAILTVTGPTVIGPLLRQVRPSPPLGSILKWEGILIDPVGAVLALLVFEVLLLGQVKGATSLVAGGILKTVGIGGGVGIGAAVFMVIVLKRQWIPEFLENFFSLAIVVGVFVLSNELQEESGLLAVTLLGIALANQE